MNKSEDVVSRRIRSQRAPITSVTESMRLGILPAMRTDRGMLVFALFALVLLTWAAIVSRPMTPIDETRYISVAWEMWLRSDFLVPFKNGMPYSDKPPLMMWLYQAGWALFGVNGLWPRLVSPIVSAGNLLLTFTLARRLWPSWDGIGGPSVLILVSCLLWIFFSTSAMFDIILAFFTLLGMHGTLYAAEGKGKHGFAMLSVAIGFGIMTKGPVILLHVLPVALLAPWWKDGLRRPRWFGGVFVAFLIGVAVALCWAVPAGISGGDAYRKAIFWGQTANRMVSSFAHQRPFWWYVPILPALFFPWLVWPGMWRAINRFIRQELDSGGRFCIAWIVPVFVAFSLISGKQPHYLIPIFPAFALLAARAMVSEERVNGLWLPALVVASLGGALVAIAERMIVIPVTGMPDGLESRPGVLLVLLAVATYLIGRRISKPIFVVALLSVAVSAFAQLTYFRPIYSAYDIRPMAGAIHQIQDAGHAVAHLGEYHDQYQFAGRLEKPLHEVDSRANLKVWLQDHPKAYAVVYTQDIGRFQGVKTSAVQRYFDGSVALLDARSALLALDMPRAVLGR